MDTAILSSKGQLVIPQQVCDLAHLMAGDEYAVNYVRGEIRLRPLNRANTTTIDDVASCLAGFGGGSGVSDASLLASALVRPMQLEPTDADCVLTMLQVAAGDISEEAFAAWLRTRVAARAG